MWVVGLIVGLVVGAMFDSVAVALGLAIAGAFTAQSLFGRKKTAVPAARPQSHRPMPMSEAEWDDEDAEAPEQDRAAAPAGDPVLALRLQVAALERRVHVLEQRLVAAPAMAEGRPRTPATTVAPPTAAPAVVPAAAPVAVPAATRSATGAPVADRLATAPPAAPRVAPAQAPRPAPVPPPPAVPLRDRLPAPIAQLIFGGNVLVKLGVLILFLGLAFLLRYTAERVTVPLELRYAGVALAGAALLCLGWFLRGRRRDYALVLQGAGVAVFYLCTLAAMKLHPLLPVGAGFGFLCAVAVLSAALAVLQNAPVLAVVAALGGFAAPVLASSGSNNPMGLFSYLLVLDLGIALIAWFRAWRLLNLIGFVGTFTLASGWGRRYYDAEQYVAQGFLLVFFVLFTAIGLFFARRTLADAPPGDAQDSLGTRAWQALQRVGRVDSALVFGVPMAAFGLQYLLLQGSAFGPAFAALGFGLFYLALGWAVFATQPRGLALLAEAYAIVGVIFGTLAIPLGLEGQWTGAAWAVEAAGMYWLGVRQARPYARAFALVVLAGAVFKLMQATHIAGLAGGPLLQGSVIGPLLVAAGGFAIWLQQRRAGLDCARGGALLQWESLAGHALPWLGLGALALLPWQMWAPPWAAAATAVLGFAGCALAQRFGLGRTFAAAGQGLQALAAASFIATLHRAEAGGALDSGWRGTLPALLIAASLLGTGALAVRQALHAALARAAAPDWSWPQAIALVAGAGFVHLAMLFQITLAQAALIWPITATAVLWVALRLQHGPLALFAGALQALAGLLALAPWWRAWEPSAAAGAFAHLGFWAPVALGLAGLRAGDWLRHAAARPRTGAFGRLGLAAVVRPQLQWVAVLWGLFWWLAGLLPESARALQLRELAPYIPAAWLGLLLATSALAAWAALRRDWRVLGQSTAGTLPAFVLVALVAGGSLFIDPWAWLWLLLDGRLSMLAYRPSAALGWLAWPLAALWHLHLLRTQARWLARPLLAALHVAGFWLFVLLAGCEAHGWLARMGAAGSSWRWLGWAAVPALALWALRSPALRRRWPLADFGAAYLRVAAAPLALGLLLWLWLGNVGSAGQAAPLPHVPLLNPLELAQWLVLAALLLWWRAAAPGWASAGVQRAAQAVAGLTALALLTGLVLRACHHYAGVPWAADALYASWLAQAALSITWALCGVAAMVTGHARRLRPLWLAGAVLLGVVVLKLFFVELADRGGLFRIVSFIGVGALLLLVGYFAPVPPARREADPATDKDNRAAEAGAT